MQKKISENKAVLMQPAEQLWSQYQLEMLVMHSKKFLNDLMSDDADKDVVAIVTEFQKAIASAEQKLKEVPSVAEILRAEQNA